jgi:hypothetical protein
MLSQGFPVNPGKSLYFFGSTGTVAHETKRTWSVGREGIPHEKRSDPRTEVTCHQGQLEMAATDRRECLRAHSTDEGGEPQGSGKGRPRYPVEGRGEQQDVSTW